MALWQRRPAQHTAAFCRPKPCCAADVLMHLLCSEKRKACLPASHVHLNEWWLPALNWLCVFVGESVSLWVMYNMDQDLAGFSLCSVADTAVQVCLSGIYTQPAARTLYSWSAQRNNALCMNFNSSTYFKKVNTMPFKSLGSVKSSNAFGKALYALHLSNQK